jgi:TPR repeat protein
MTTDKSELDLRYDDANYASTIGRYDEAFPLFAELAQSGHIGATVALAHMYLRGNGVARNVEKGLRLMESAAFLGHSNAAFSLGALYRTGDCDVPRHAEKSRQFFLLAKKLGCELPVEDYL